MKQCPACHREFKEHMKFCPFDAQALVEKPEQDALFDDKYRLEAKIGEGGMGKVYRATHVHMDTTVAIKILNPSLVSDQNAVERFRREARAAARINHPNAVAVTDFGVIKDTGTVYIVMEFLEGSDLREKLKKLKRLDYEEAFIILYQACSALQAAHSKGIIHRDLKPDNIWILKDEEGIERVKVLDFGIAKLKTKGATTLTEQGMIVGTPHYMSPEQCSGAELDARSDVYSLGIILYEMLTGQVPFNAPSSVGIVVMHMSEQPRPLHELRPEIPKQIEEVVMRALEKQREDRQESAMQLAQDFETALHAAGIELKLTPVKTPSTPFSVPSTPYPPFERPTTGETARQTGSIEKTEKTEHLSGQPQTRGLQVAMTGSEKQSSPGQLSRQSQPVGTSGGIESGGLLFGSTIAAEPEKKSSQKLIFASIALILLLVAAVGGGLWFTSRPEVKPEKPAEPARPAAPPGMVLIPAGKFIMGNNESAFEKPEHEVTLNSFYMDLTEVTNEAYAEFVKATKHPAPPNWVNGSFPPGEEKYPVTNVSSNDAVAYARWAGKELPSEEQWEYAARGTDKRLYPWGNDYSPANLNSKDSDKNRATPVGSYSKGSSPFGVMDLAGNVWEWTADTFYPYPGNNEPADPKIKGLKIIRGGSFKSEKKLVTTYFREMVQPDTKDAALGFRCVKPAQ